MPRPTGRLYTLTVEANAAIADDKAFHDSATLGFVATVNSIAAERDALRAQLAELENHVGEHGCDIAKVQAERDALKAENERLESEAGNLRECMDEINHLRKGAP